MRELGHAHRQPLLPEGHVVPGPELGDPEVSRKLLERADEGRPLSPRHLRDHAREPLRQADGVADERHPLSGKAVDASGELPRLGHGQDGLAAARSATHLHPVQQPRDREDGRLLDGQSLGATLPLVGLGEQGPLRQVAAAQDLDDELAVRQARDAVPALLPGTIRTLSLAPLDVSATQIRAKLQANEDVSALLPPAVREPLMTYLHCKKTQ